MESNKFDDYADKKINQLKEKMNTMRTEPRSQLEEIMWKRNVTFNELMRLTGIKHRPLSNMITGRQKSFQLETLKVLCKALKTTPNELFNIK